MSNLIGGLLESPWWLLLAFCSKILGGGRDLHIVILLKKKCTLIGTDIVSGDTETLLGGKQIVLYVLSGGGDAEIF